MAIEIDYRVEVGCERYPHADRAEIDRDEEEADRYGDWLASGNHPRL